MKTTLKQKIKALKAAAGKRLSDVGRKAQEKEAVKFFQRTVKQLSGRGKTSQSDFLSGRRANRMQPGVMFTFLYDAKHKKTLPYYDHFPMIVLLDLTSDGWTGINLHYFPPVLRALVLGRLMSTAGVLLTRNQRMRVNYRIVSAAANLSVGKAGFKRYLAKHVRSNIAIIEPNEWQHAVMLPLEAFQKASNQTVWRDTVAKIKKAGYS